VTAAAAAAAATTTTTSITTTITVIIRTGTCIVGAEFAGQENVIQFQSPRYIHLVTMLTRKRTESAYIRPAKNAYNAPQTP